MELYRFDEEVSVPATDEGSQYRVGPLIGDGSRVRVELLYLPPGGRVAPRPTAVRRMLAVVTGEGTVSDGDSAGRPIRAGYAAVWEPGDHYAASTDGGLTGVVLNGAFDVWALGVTRDIVVVDYDPRWPDWFETVRAYVWPAVGDVARRVDHVGSTSVPGLCAKPVIDTDVVVGSEADVPVVIERLATLGYRWRGDLGIIGRESFALDRDVGLPAHNLYVVVEDNEAHLDHWLLRDLLRGDPDARDRYGALKRDNVRLAERDMDVYVAAKAQLVGELLLRARAERGLLGGYEPSG